MERYWVFDFQKAAAPRWVSKEPPERLEHYAFEKRGDGSYALAVQAGWPGARATGTGPATASRCPGSGSARAGRPFWTG